MSKVKRSSLPSAIIIYLRLLAVLGGKARRDHTLLSRLKIFLWLSLASSAAPQKFALTHTFFLLYFLSCLPTSRMIVVLWSALWYSSSKNTKPKCALRTRCLSCTQQHRPKPWNFEIYWEDAKKLDKTVWEKVPFYRKVFVTLYLTLLNSFEQNQQNKNNFLTTKNNFFLYLQIIKQDKIFEWLFFPTLCFRLFFLSLCEDIGIFEARRMFCGIVQ